LARASAPGGQQRSYNTRRASNTCLWRTVEFRKGGIGECGPKQARRGIAVAYEAGPDGLGLARWLRRHGIEADVIYPTSGAPCHKSMLGEGGSARYRTAEACLSQLATAANHAIAPW
jgi:hypothetical protein